MTNEEQTLAEIRAHALTLDGDDLMNFTTAYFTIKVLIETYGSNGLLALALHGAERAAASS